MDARTGDVLYETDGFSRRFPASITKIMTALLVLEQVEDLEERIIMSENAVTLPHYAGRMGLVEGEDISVLEALYGIMLPSANDIARALAEHVSGSIPEFVTLMNNRAYELGAHNTRFINPCGLPGNGQHVTAYDIALIMQAAIQHPLFVEIISTPYFSLPPTNKYEDARIMRNSNVMVRPSRDEFNPRIIGGKTGFTNAAQHTLVSYAEHDGLEVIISVLYASPRGAIFSDTAALVAYIFDDMPLMVEIEIPIEPVATVDELEADDAIEEDYEEAEAVEDEEDEDDEEYTNYKEDLTIEEDLIPSEIEIESEIVDESETIPAFAYYNRPVLPYDPIPPYEEYSSAHPEPPEPSNSEAAAVASISIAMVAASILFIKWAGKRNTASV